MDKVKGEAQQTYLLTIPEVAGLLRLSRASVYRLLENGSLPVARIGRSVRIPRAAVEEWTAKITTAVRAA